MTVYNIAIQHYNNSNELIALLSLNTTMRLLNSALLWKLNAIVSTMPLQHQHDAKVELKNTSLKCNWTIYNRHRLTISCTRLICSEDRKKHMKTLTKLWIAAAAICWIHWRLQLLRNCFPPTLNTGTSRHHVKRNNPGKWLCQKYQVQDRKWNVKQDDKEYNIQNKENILKGRKKTLWQIELL